MKNKITSHVVCFGLLIANFATGQSLVTTYNNNFTPPACTSIMREWSKCKCNDAPWPANLNAPFEWKGATEGNTVADHLNNDKIFGLSGTAVLVQLAGSDFPMSHIFGYNPAKPNAKLYVDWESYIVVDPPFGNLLALGNNPQDKNGMPISGEYTEAIKTGLTLFNREHSTINSGVMGLELDSALIPALYRSKNLDRTAVFGDLIVDCGHDEGGFHTEIHPPLMLVNARQLKGLNPLNVQQKFGDSISGLTFASIISNPYKITQLYNDHMTFMNASSVELAKAISLAEGVGFFSGFLAPSYHLKMDAEVAEKPFRGIQLMTFNVFPDKPKASPDMILWAQYHFTVRNGVTVSVTKADDHVTVFVSMNDAVFKSANNLLKKHSRNLNKDDFNKMGFGLAYTGAFFGTNLIPGLAPILAQGIETTVYENPVPKSPFDIKIFPSNEQPGVYSDISDDQPYPIYGWMTVGWKEPAKINFCAVHPSPFKANTKEILFFPNNLKKSQLITITNPTNAAIQIGTLYLDGEDANKFALQQEPVILLRPGATQPPEHCSSTILPPNGSCSFRVAVLSTVPGHLLRATINIPTGGACELKIPVRELNQVQ